MSVEMNVISTGIFFAQFAKKLVENVFLITIWKNNYPFLSKKINY